MKITIHADIPHEILFQHLIAMAKCRSVGSDVTLENFPIQTKGISTIDIVPHCSGWADSSKENIKLMSDVGRRPAYLEEVLAYVAYNVLENDPRFMEKRAFAALGSIWTTPHGLRIVPCVYMNGHLGTAWFVGGWDKTWQFPTVLK